MATFLTATEAKTLERAYDLLHDIEARAETRPRDDEAAGRARDFGRIAGAADAAASTLFNVLTVVAVFGKCDNTRAAIDQRHAT